MLSVFIIVLSFALWKRSKEIYNKCDNISCGLVRYDFQNCAAGFVILHISDWWIPFIGVPSLKEHMFYSEDVYCK